MRIFAATAAAALVAGCTVMRPVPAEAKHIDNLRPREMVWVVPDSGLAWRGAFYRVENDSLFLLAGNRKRAIALDRIDSLSVRRRSPERVRMVMYGVGGGIAVLAILAVTGVLSDTAFTL
jgi:hypothetical protein